VDDEAAISQVAGQFSGRDWRHRGQVFHEGVNFISEARTLTIGSLD
jgi:hypothetical protein